MSAQQKKSGKKKTVLLVLLLLVLLPVFLFLCRLCAYSATNAAKPTTELKHYRSERLSGWINDDPYAVFPEETVVSQAAETDYLYKRVITPLPLLYDNDIVCYLKCAFAPQTFSEEVQRLSDLCGEPDTERYSVPAYVFVSGGNYYQYALPDEQTNTIYYIAFQYRVIAEEYIDPALLPIRKVLAPTAA